jgi:hypothetical protein
MKLNMDDPQKLMTIRAARLTLANRAKVVASGRLLQMRDGRMNPGKLQPAFFASNGNKKDRPMKNAYAIAFRGMLPLFRSDFQIAGEGMGPHARRRQAARAMHQACPPQEEGAGKAGCPLHPQPRVRNNKAHERSHHRFTGFTRPSLRNGFNGFLRALPGDRAFLPPSPAEKVSANLTPASGRQDHTTSPSA